MAADKEWLDVPFSEKDEAKAAGARWDAQARRWYAPAAGMEALARWASRPPIPAILPGEDRSYGGGLFVDLVPKSCWFTNARSCIEQRDWERLARMVVARAGEKCEACGAGRDPGQKRYLDVHERWSYDDVLHVQALRRLICLCSFCHATTHFGLSRVRGEREVALQHLMSVRSLSRDEAEAHVADAFRVWQQRSAWSWELDLRILTDCGIAVRHPEDPGERERLAARPHDEVPRVWSQAHARAPSTGAAPLTGRPVEPARRSWMSRVFRRA